MQKKGENARLIPKFMQKRQKCKQKDRIPKKHKMHFQLENSCKKRAKMHFKFRNSYKKSKNEKKNLAHLFGFFRFYILCAFFCLLNLKIDAKNTKMQKQFSYSKNIQAKKGQNIISKNHAKKGRNAEKMMQKGGEYRIYIIDCDNFFVILRQNLYFALFIIFFPKMAIIIENALIIKRPKYKKL